MYRSLVGKATLLLVVFVAVPVILYAEFRQADADKRTLLMDSVREQGRLIAESLRPLVAQEGPSTLPALNEEIKRFAAPQTGVKVLYRPAGEIGADGFYFVASEPPVRAAALTNERDRMVELGVFDNLAASCQGELPIALRNRLPGGEEELLTSITPITTKSGCWAVITTHSTSQFLDTALGQPYWNTIEVRIAAAIYLVMALLTFGLFFGVWRSLMRFRKLARSIRTGRAGDSSFATQNEVPELAVVAEEFDRMTGALRESAKSIRVAAEDNAHAFKTPLAIMRQSIEPIRRIIPSDNPRGRRALDVLEESVDRLDHLVASARQLDQTTAELLDPPRNEIDLSKLIERMLMAYADTFASRRLILNVHLDPGVIVRAGEDLIETVIENVIDNGIEVSPRGAEISVELRRNKSWAELALRDRGPGVPSADLERIFERYVSLRPPPTAKAAPASKTNGSHVVDINNNPGADPHLGIGLWIVRRNLQAIGGDVRAEYRPDGGLSMIMRLPLAT